MRPDFYPEGAATSGEVHVWAVRPRATRTQRANLLNSLSQDEKQRAESFRFEKHRNIFIIARGLLRAILGWYVGRSAKDISFQYGPRGKPALRNKRSEQVLHFNLAHTEDCVLYAFTDVCEVGVDLELIRELPEAQAIAEHFFAKGEQSELFRLAPDKRPEAFFNCWTRKEAYLKATGEGFSVPLHRFQVSLAPHQPAAFVSLPQGYAKISQWTLLHLIPSPGYVAAVAIPSPNCALRQRSFESVAACQQFLGTEDTLIDGSLGPRSFGAASQAGKIDAMNH